MYCLFLRVGLHLLNFSQLKVRYLGQEGSSVFLLFTTERNRQIQGRICPICFRHLIYDGMNNLLNAFYLSAVTIDSYSAVTIGR